MALEEFIKCKSDATSIGRYVEIQVNTPTDVSNDMWYIIKDDFKASAWNITRNINTEESSMEGSARVGQDVTSFGESLNITLTDDNASKFLQRCYEQT